jgi:hypothetical protein
LSLENIPEYSNHRAHFREFPSTTVDFTELEDCLGTKRHGLYTQPAGGDKAQQSRFESIPNILRNSMVSAKPLRSRNSLTNQKKLTVCRWCFLKHEEHEGHEDKSAHRGTEPTTPRVSSFLLPVSFLAPIRNSFFFKIFLRALRV